MVIHRSELLYREFYVIDRMGICDKKLKNFISFHY
jgi:hypothetical protein